MNVELLWIWIKKDKFKLHSVFLDDASDSLCQILAFVIQFQCLSSKQGSSTGWKRMMIWWCKRP